jgi:hypothetical protein
VIFIRGVSYYCFSGFGENTQSKPVLLCEVENAVAENGATADPLEVCAAQIGTTTKGTSNREVMLLPQQQRMGRSAFF